MKTHVELAGFDDAAAKHKQSTHMSLKLKLRHNSTMATKAQKKMHSVIASLDQDGDGHIDAQELYYGIKEEREKTKSWKRTAIVAMVGGAALLGVTVGLMVWANALSKDMRPTTGSVDTAGAAS